MHRKRVPTFNKKITCIPPTKRNVFTNKCKKPCKRHEATSHVTKRCVTRGMLLSKFPDLYGKDFDFDRYESAFYDVDVPIVTTEMPQWGFSLKEYIVELVNGKTNLGRRDPFNLSLDTFSDDLKMGMFFRYGTHTVVSIYYTQFDSTPQVSFVDMAHAPICAGQGRVIYTKVPTRGLFSPQTPHRVYENSIDLNHEVELCHSLSTNYVEKNWGCFGRTNTGEYFIVYSVIPLRIFKVFNNACSDAVVKEEYPNFNAIEKMYVDRRTDGGDYGIFRGGTRGIEFGQEYLFVGHVTLHKADNGCFPNWFVQRNRPDTNPKPNPNRMYFMYFFTIRLVNGMFELSRMSSCFQPPSPTGSIHKIIFPSGIARRGSGSDVVVSLGRDDDDCLITFYTEAEVNTMLAPVSSWNEHNYVFHPNHAAALRLMWKDNLPTYQAGLIGTSVDFDGRFNPAITNYGYGGTFVTAWRNFTGNIDTWLDGYNMVAIEACTIKIEAGKLVYERVGEHIEFRAGVSGTGGEDPRLITENNSPLILVNDFDASGKQRMYIHNLSTDTNFMATHHTFCHSISGEKEKNWGPFYVQGILQFVYKVDPLIIGRVHRAPFQVPEGASTNVECAIQSEAPTPANLKEIFKANGLQVRGGTPGIEFGDNEYLFVGHSFQESRPCRPDFVVQRFVNASDQTPYQKDYSKLYMAFFYTIEIVGSGWKLKRLSCCSHLPGKKENFAKIHFPGGLAKANLGGEFEDAFIVSFGDKDMHGGFCAVNRKFLEYVLRPVETLNVNNYVVDVNYFQSIANLDPIDDDL